MKLLAALILIGLTGYALSDDSSLKLLAPVGRLAAGVGPSGEALVIQVDKRGYAICSNEKPPAP